LEKTLQHLVDKKVHDYADNVINERFETHEEALLNYQEIVEYDPILDFKIIDVIEENENEVSFMVEVGLERAVLEEPYHMVKSDGDWNLFIKEDPIEIGEYTVKEVKTANTPLLQQSSNSDDFTTQHWRRNFSGTISCCTSTSNFDLLSGYIGINVTTHSMNANFGSLYSGWYGMRDTSNRQLHTPVRFTSTGSRTVIYDYWPNRGHLRITTDIGSNGSYRFAGYLDY
jgi:hypothetical protein